MEKQSMTIVLRVLYLAGMLLGISGIYLVYLGSQGELPRYALVGFTFPLAMLILSIHMLADLIKTMKIKNATDSEYRRDMFKLLVFVVSLVTGLTCIYQLSSYNGDSVRDFHITLKTGANLDLIRNELSQLLPNDKIKVEKLKDDKVLLIILGISKDVYFEAMNQLKNTELMSEAEFNLEIMQDEFAPILHEVLDLAPNEVIKISVKFTNPMIITSNTRMGIQCFIGFKETDAFPKLSLDFTNQDDINLINSKGFTKSDFPKYAEHFWLRYSLSNAPGYEGKIGGFYYDDGYFLFPLDSMDGGGCDIPHRSKEKYETHEMSSHFFNTFNSTYLASVFFPQLSRDLEKAEWIYRHIEISFQKYIKRVDRGVRDYLRS
jgi:hypothetical protein